MRRAVVAGAAVAGAVAVGGAAVWAAGGDDGRAGRTAAPATAPVERGDLVDTETVDGTLTYADVTAVWTGASGVVTWAPEQGASIGRGETLIGVDGRPVTLMYGNAPMYRTLGQGAEGKDVRSLEENLKELGYGGEMTVDGEFTAATEAAVCAWQDERGLPETGTVAPAQVVFLGGAVRVREVKTPEGGRASGGQPVLTVSGEERVVHVDLDADRQELAKEGAKAAVELPGGTRVEGTIAEVGAVAESGGKQQDTTVDVEIAVDYDGRFDEAPVRVELAGERRSDVLSVPVEALLAVRGGFGVEVVEGARTRVVPVTVGAFGGGRVEVSGAGLRAGTKVGVPAE
ncbi:peptidoglycan-binding protein [Actinomadura algeriensis]|uniref:Peptidoglycan hydrolase-like protein with peptidoglycan-binding domain n=1 Tax=Actinomadura algeriensis TaxID=1679523 RepID=A0ABR9K4T1_9ACTN|nr:peptidoglycan-binding protein [Actinomadura algeriensis]MBE1537618.1 peptidoglycan hydrolase-like protein with peptidoglycan-binding domain [Actinomadura algeriensis]